MWLAANVRFPLLAVIRELTQKGREGVWGVVMPLFEENAEVLRELAACGVDLSQTRVVDYSHVFPDAVSARNFVEACKSAGYDATDTTDEAEQHDVTISKEMTPTCENITQIEDVLSKLAERHNGRSDGWGFLGD